ncbi:Processive diacylglycerol beta-glucosyltransferase [Paenibacillus solanacearum]|uniref:Processive diacylglycerol beta-glucosyltransferase n=1 Tax=Paenibacillus solanacearum TaxID=2048548 RepID=A0A916K766_9BACL|nr:glycosyltransferase [Paenibacillus solanacearum]CAG7642637.1 Processive diacylglycerol beta-glucosyltransferase [Paenibacillus solanacearum]
MQTTRGKLLILTGALGDGHNKAAQAIVEAARQHRPEMDVKVVDFLEWTHPYMHVVGKYCFMQWVKSLPSVYGYLYRKTRDDNTFSGWFKRMRTFSADRMVALLEEVQPTEVVSTFPGAAAAMSYLKMNGLTDVTTATVITDYTDHSYWIHPLTDRYIVGAEHVQQALLRHRVPADRIIVTGIPIRLPFTQSYDKESLREKFGLDRQMPTVLVMGGGHGLIGKQFASILQEIRFPCPVQFIIVCGRNEKLRQRLEEELRAAGMPHKVMITGFVDYVHELMALSDLIVTKPGGLTVSEALALELPMLLYKPIPGQEQDNARYLQRIGAAVEAHSAVELAMQLQDIIENRSLLFRMKQNAKAARRKEGAAQALAAILELNAGYTAAWRGRAVAANA